MSKVFLKTAVQIGFSLTMLAAAAALYKGSVLWACGVLTASCWMFLNVYFLFRLLELGFRVGGHKDTQRVMVLSILKFPVIYLTGFFILKTRYFPMESILTGLTLFIIGMIVAWISANNKQEGRREKGEGRKLSAVCLLSSAISFGFIAPTFASEVARESSHVAASHASGHGSSLHTVNFVGLISEYAPKPVADFLKGSENIIFGVIVIAILSLIFYSASRNMKLVPGRFQSACESVVEALDNFVCGILGPEGRKYTPFLGTLFLYILTMNLLGLIPLMKSNTANSMTLSGPVPLPVPTTTVALALIVFVAVQAIGIKKQGLLGYLDHMAGSPRDAFGWVMAPLMFPIHLIGEFARPFSLTFRLFCNTMGGHVLVAVFIGMGVASLLIPFQAPFLLFEIATSTIQAFVFTLLSTVYIAMMLPHDSHGVQTQGH